MTNGGFLILLISVGSVSLLFGWCLFKIATVPEKDGKASAQKETSGTDFFRDVS